MARNVVKACRPPRTMPARREPEVMIIQPLARSITPAPAPGRIEE
jgi:hypothetical protein